ncbi:MAG: hypothetical protein IJ911_00880 [Salinivirgaceae bacterium]|nr:hypothetical protein [Salinivirgaceae bacterium]
MAKSNSAKWLNGIRPTLQTKSRQLSKQKAANSPNKKPPTLQKIFGKC